MQKKLNENTIVNELKGGSAYFRDSVEQQKPSPKMKRQENERTIEPANYKTENSVNNNEGKHASVLARKQASTQAGEQGDMLIEPIILSAKRMGKDVVYVRLAQDEKISLSRFVSEENLRQKQKGSRLQVSETLIAKIGLTFLMEDYKKNKQKSVLRKVLAELT